MIHFLVTIPWELLLIAGAVLVFSMVYCGALLWDAARWWWRNR